jgi:hypothetical protein
MTEKKRNPYVVHEKRISERLKVWVWSNGDVSIRDTSGPHVTLTEEEQKHFLMMIMCFTPQFTFNITDKDDES